MPAPKGHVHISERETAHVWPNGLQDDRHWEDCTMCAALMVARVSCDPAIPAHHGEAEAIRQAAGLGPIGGSSSSDALRGLQRRHAVTGLDIVANSDFDALWGRLTPGTVAAAQGSMAAFPRGHTLRRFDPGFIGSHDVFIYRYDDSDHLWWDDPLAPIGSYTGQTVTKAQFKAYVNKFPAGSAIVGTLLTEKTVANAPITSETPVLIDVPAGANLIALDGKTVIRALTQAYVGRYSPFASGALRAWYVTVAGVRQLAYSKPVAVHAVPAPLPPKDTTPFTQAQLDAAREAGRVAGAAAGIVLGVAQERNRIRTFIGL